MRVARLTTLAATLASVLLLPACGQKGPLYLPQDASLTQTPVSTSADKESTDTDEAATKR